MARYLPLFQARQADLLAQGRGRRASGRRGRHLGAGLVPPGRGGPSGGRPVRLLAFLAPEPVPLALLLIAEQPADLPGPEATATIGPLLGDPVAVGAAIIALRRYSLIAPAGDGLVLVHRLVQAITRARLTADLAAQWKQAAAALVEGAVPTDPNFPRHGRYSLLLPHARAVLNLTSSGLRQITVSLGPSGSYAAARDMSG